MGDHVVHQHEIKVVASEEAAALARAVVTKLGVPQVEERMDVLRVSISEVVTNAVQHGALRPDIDTLRITVSTGLDMVRITVEQPTVADVMLGQPRLGSTDPGGFGLHLVDRLADNWGHDPGPPGRVWIEFRRPTGST